MAQRQRCERRNLFSRLHQSACPVSRSPTTFKIHQFKSSLCNQSFFSFSNFRKPCNSPNL